MDKTVKTSQTLSERLIHVCKKPPPQYMPITHVLRERSQSYPDHEIMFPTPSPGHHPYDQLCGTSIPLFGTEQRSREAENKTHIHFSYHSSFKCMFNKHVKSTSLWIAGDTLASLNARVRVHTFCGVGIHRTCHQQYARSPC